MDMEISCFLVNICSTILCIYGKLIGKSNSQWNSRKAVKEWMQATMKVDGNEFARDLIIIYYFWRKND